MEEVMTQEQQAAALAGDLERVLDRYRSEFNITLLTALGALELVKLSLFWEESEDDDSQPE